MLKFLVTLVVAVMVFLVAANLRVEYPQSFILGISILAMCVASAFMTIVTLFDYISSLGEEKDNFSSRGGFNRSEREMYRNVHFTRRSKEYAIHRHIWM